MPTYCSWREYGMSSLMEQITAVMAGGGNCLVSGLDGTSKAYVLNRLMQSTGNRVIYVTGEVEEGYDVARSLRGIAGPEKVRIFPPRNYLVGGSGDQAKENLERISLLTELVEHPRQSGIMIISAASLMFETIPPEALKTRQIKIQTGQSLGLERVLKGLVEYGYVRQSMVESPGHFAARGGILDIFPVRAAEPLRIEYFGDEIESMRHFSIDSQLSTGALKNTIIWPAEETSGEGGRLWDYLPEKCLVWVDDVHRLQESWANQLRRYKNFEGQARREKQSPGLKAYSWSEMESFMDSRPLVFHSVFARNPGNYPVQLLQHISQHEVEPLWARPDGLKKSVLDWKARGWQVLLAIPEKSTRDRIRKDLDESLVSGGYEFVKWRIEKGFVSSTLKLAVVAESDLVRKKSVRSKKVSARQSSARPDLGVGDHVVHEQYGIGIFQGITSQEVDGVLREYLTIQYAGTDRLYLPVDKLGMLTRFSGGGQPKLNKLGGSEWERTKKKVRASVQDMAEELLALYSAREKIQGFAFSPDTVWQHEFAEGFEHEETPDQARSVIEVLADMEKTRPMDRLVCGDVGYGKTEVAMRAAFKALMDKKQVAVLVPTTILAEQHYHTFVKRFEAFPVSIEVLSRFKTPGQQKKVIDDLRRGLVDIVIGTHRLLSADVQFQDLGLLVVDEEHRFGVRQKERIKAMTRTVDVLSLSATPIPRTLHMAMSGLRDLSVIETPPPERYPINTYVMEFSPDLVREAIKAEIDRGGQVFYVHNRIHSMDRIKREIEALVPELVVDHAHGRMDEKELAQVMTRFLEGESDVLLATTIIESGLDMPNVNTLIVDEADRMGLAQLYQLRGRIGRSNRVAYAYLTYRPDKAISELAQKRLNAIREFVELGSGMRIALQDLEIRGAGNLLGAEQHGYIEAVGFDLYCRLLEEETARHKGLSTARPEMPGVDVRVDSYIPDSYIDDPAVKIQIYRQAMMADNLGQIREIEQGLRDRFGPLPLPAENLLRIARLRLAAAHKNIKHINTSDNQIELTLEKPLGKGAQELADLQHRYGLKISVTRGNVLVLKSRQKLSLDAVEALLEII